MREFIAFLCPNSTGAIDQLIFIMISNWFTGVYSYLAENWPDIRGTNAWWSTTRHAMIVQKWAIIWHTRVTMNNWFRNIRQRNTCALHQGTWHDLKVITLTTSVTLTLHLRFAYLQWWRHDMKRFPYYWPFEGDSTFQVLVHLVANTAFQCTSIWASASPIHAILSWCRDLSRQTCRSGHTT